MPNTIILLVRHADVHNPNQIIYGRLPRFRLSEDGLKQAEATAAALADEPITTIYTSPMLRARQTARAIARHHPRVKVRTARGLNEVGTSWQGTRWTDVGHDANLYEPRRDPSDETLHDVGERVARLVRRLAKRHPGETVVCVSHADPIMIGRVHLQGIPLSFEAVRGPDYPERASVTRLELLEDGSLAVSYFNPAQELITPTQAAKEEAPAEASEQGAPELVAAG
ncbi:MAG: histidine phosphatase family protein [Chloroflexota bacterium]|nr:histidine phosphatase family protein [Chloroflexota bacterium]